MLIVRIVPASGTFPGVCQVSHSEFRHHTTILLGRAAQKRNNISTECAYCQLDADDSLERLRTTRPLKMRTRTSTAVWLLALLAVLGGAGGQGASYQHISGEAGM